MTEPAQLPLELNSDVDGDGDRQLVGNKRASRGAAADLIVTPSNHDAVAFVNSWPHWPTPIAVLAGPVGAGKSHLATYWQQLSGAVLLTLPLKDQLALTEPTCVVLEDVDTLDFDDRDLFHLINGVRANQGNLLMTSRTWPGSWSIRLPDLQSRMKLAHLIELNEPDDALLAAVLTKLFFDRQIEIDQPVIEYMVLRMERSLACARQLASTLDKLSLARKRAITKPLAAEALRILDLDMG